MNKVLRTFFPFLGWWPLVNRQSLWADFLAGLTGAVIVLPQSVAFALIAGLPPIYGIYTAMITPIVAALFGSSYYLISGPTTPISIVVFAAISTFAEAQSADYIRLALTLTFLAGLIQFIMGLARMGTLVNFVSHTVIVGFTAGAGILIGVKQLRHVLGIDLTTGQSFIDTLIEMSRRIGETEPLVLAVGLSTLLIALLLRWWSRKIPYMLVAMVGGSLLAIWLGGEAAGIATIGELPAEFPSFSPPDLSEATLKSLLPKALAVALLGLIEAVAIAKAIANQPPGPGQTQQRIDGNQEFLGQGLSNLVGSFFSCYAGSGSFTRSGINFQTGARTPMAAIFAALLLMMILLFIAPWTAYLPIPAMGGIIILVAYNLIDFHHIKTILKSSKRESAVLFVTLLATLFLDLEFAIYIGILLSLFFYLERTAQPHLALMAPDPDEQRRRFTYIIRKDGLQQCPQLTIVRISGSIYFGAIDHIADYFGKLYEGEEKHILIIAKGVNFIDLAGAEWLVSEAARWKDKGGGLYFSGLKRIAQDVLIPGGFKKQIGEDHFYFTKKEAVAEIYQRLDQERCKDCRKRIFLECGDLPALPDVSTQAQSQEK